MSDPRPPQGCYLIFFQKQTQSDNRVFDGTLRITHEGNKNLASADLYERKTSSPIPDPAKGVPIFPIKNYRYYVKVVELPNSLSGEGSVEFKLSVQEYHKLDEPGDEILEWIERGTFTATLRREPPPNGPEYPDAGEGRPLFLSGKVKKDNGAEIGEVTIGWVASNLRRATIKIDQVQFQQGGSPHNTESPENNGSGATWETVFDKVGWKITRPPNKTDIPEPVPDPKSWTEGELHKAMTDATSNLSLNKDWVYHLLCVREIDNNSANVIDLNENTDPPDLYGWMYDDWEGNVDDKARQGAAIATHQPVPAEWLTPNGPGSPGDGMTRLGKVSTVFFRTAVHEIGHAMHLYHNHQGRFFMRETRGILDEATSSNKFPTNIVFDFSPADKHRLRHLPDIFVRPGGVPFSEEEEIFENPFDRALEEAPGLRLEVFPMSGWTRVPWGAPVRINLRLSNESEESIDVPSRLSLKGGQIRGCVIDEHGVKRYFHPIVHWLDRGVGFRKLAPRQSAVHSVALLRGIGGPLFPKHGQYAVRIEASWDTRKGQMLVVGETRSKVEVFEVDSTKHVETARRILGDRNAFLAFVIGGDHLIEHLRPALKDEILASHYAIAEARTLASRHFKRVANPSEACKRLSTTTPPVLSTSEIGRAIRLAQTARSAGKEASDSAAALASILRKVAGAAGKEIDSEVLSALNSVCQECGVS